MADSPAAQQQQFPNLDPYNSSNGGGSTFEATKSKVVSSQSFIIPLNRSASLNHRPAAAQSTMNSIANSQTVQTLQNGPVAEKARAEADQTKNEFSSLASSRQVPTNTAATGQNLTHYHSFFYTLLSWENPRATAISYVTVILFIFATRYLPLVRYGLRLTWMVLGITAAAEVAGKLFMESGFTSKIRPKKYYTIPRESLEAMLEDTEQLINFFVIEIQRIVFAENVYTTIAAFASSLLTYILIKIMPAWGLALFFTTAIYFLPLIYTSNKELIDGHLENASHIISEQTSQVRDLASQHTSKAMEASSQAVKEYSNKAQEMIGQTKKAAVDKGYVSAETAEKMTPAASKVSSHDFPAAPSQEPAPVQDANLADTKLEPLPAQ